MIGEFIGREPDRPPLREQCRLVCGPVYVIITRLVSRSNGYSGSSFSLDSVHENVVLWAENPFSNSGCIV